MKINAYLQFDGQCKRAFEFYQQCLGGELETMTHAETPMGDNVSDAWRDRIMHARLVIGDQVLMGSDLPPDSHEQHGGFSVALQVDDPQEADRIFHALAENGTIDMPIGETFWAKRFGMLVDQFGVPWMINCDKAG